MVNSATWGKQKPTAKWTKTDCDTFYEVRLSLVSRPSLLTPRRP